jgi:hypothetical protein
MVDNIHSYGLTAGEFCHQAAGGKQKLIPPKKNI